MMKNMNELPEIQLTEAEIRCFQMKLTTLLASLIRQYTSGESTSVRVETAQEVMRSMCFCLKLSMTHPTARWRVLMDTDLEEEYKNGVAQIKGKSEYGKGLWESACAGLPCIENRAMTDTLKSIGTFWKRYDYRFFAHAIPCDIDYQLALPVSESVVGVDFINCYLERLLIENRFISKFQREKVASILTLYCPDHRREIINLFEPVAAGALGLAVIGEPFEGLMINSDHIDKLAEVFQDLDKKEILAKLIDAVDIVSIRDGMPEEQLRSYLCAYSKELACRVAALRDCGGLPGIFVSLPCI